MEIENLKIKREFIGGNLMRVEANVDEALRKVEELKTILEIMKEEEESKKREIFIDTVRRIKNKRGVRGVKLDIQRDRIVIEK